MATGGRRDFPSIADGMALVVSPPLSSARHSDGGTILNSLFFAPVKPSQTQSNHFLERQANPPIPPTLHHHAPPFAFRGL